MRHKKIRGYSRKLKRVRQRTIHAMIVAIASDVDKSVMRWAISSGRAMGKSQLASDYIKFLQM